MLQTVEQQWQGGCSVDSGLTHKGGVRRVVGAPQGCDCHVLPRGFMWEEGWTGCSDCFHNSGRALPRRSAAVGKASQQGGPYRGQALPLPRACSGPRAAEEGAGRRGGLSSVPGQADCYQAYSQPGPSQQRGWVSVLRRGTHSPTPQSSGEMESRGMRETVRQTGPRVKPGSLGCQHSLGVGFLQPRKWLLHSPLAPAVPVHHLPDPGLQGPGCASAGVPSRPRELVRAFQGAASPGEIPMFRYLIALYS